MNNSTKNIGTIDRIIRTIIAIGLLWFAWTYEGLFIVSIVATLVGIALLLSAITGFCFILRALGMSTRDKNDKSKTG